MSVDLGNCEREPIHIPGAIQPHGVLLALSEPALTIMHVSDNVETHLRLGVREVLGRPLSEVLEPASADAVREALRGDRWDDVNPLRIEAAGQSFDGIVHRHAGMAIVELEPASGPDPTIAGHPLRLALRDIQHARDFAQLCESVVLEVQRLTGFERVMFYRFDARGHGSVVAEAKAESLDPYLGLHYPASDIPQQARELYLKNWLRIIPDARYVPARVVPELRADTREPLDLSSSVLRSVSPIHREYLANMGVHASMSVSLVVRDRLWGLISCANHSGPRHIRYEVRSACEVLGRLVSLQLAALEDQEAAAARTARRGTQDDLVEAMRRSDAKQDVLAGLLDRPDALMRLVDARGAAVVGVDASVGSPTVNRGGVAPEGQPETRTVRTCGDTPPLELVEAIARRLDDVVDLGVFATASLAEIFPPARAVKDVASGVITFALPGTPRRRLLWFRPEIVQTVAWGGDPRKPAELHEDLRLHPRRSFELWKEEVRLHARPWTASDLDAVTELRRNAVELDLERQVSRQQMAVRARDDLVAVVSHDLKNPLGVIQMQAAIMLTADAGGNEPSPRLRAGAERIQRAVNTMNTLIHDLLDLAKIEAGRFVVRRRAEDLCDIVDEMLFILRPLATNKRIDVVEQMRAACRVRVDRDRIFQVLSNLIGNAIKFTPEGGTITVRSEQNEDELWVSVADSGPGVPAEQLPYLFERYWQARKGSTTGSGLGLYIAKGIVEAHGGRIWGESPAAGGAKFTFTLPLK